MVKLFFANRKRYDTLQEELEAFKVDKPTKKSEVQTKTNGVVHRYFEKYPRDLQVDPNGKSRIRVGRVPREKVSYTCLVEKIVRTYYRIVI